MRHSPRHLVRRRQRLSQTFSIDFTLSANAFAEPAYASMTNFTADVLSRSIANPNGIFAQPSYALLKNFRTDVLDSPIAQSIDREPERRHQVILCSSDELHGRPADARHAVRVRGRSGLLGMRVRDQFRAALDHE